MTLDCPVRPLGGAISNMYAMLLARFKMFPEVKEKGMSSVPRLVAFTSEHVGIHVCTSAALSICVLLDLLRITDHRFIRSKHQRSSQLQE